MSPNELKTKAIKDVHVNRDAISKIITSILRKLKNNFYKDIELK
mgnify:CR=1 FL=1